MYLIGRTGADKKYKLRQVALILVLFTLGTIRIGCNSHFFEMMFVEKSSYPGGPAAWLFENYNIPENVVGTVAFVISDVVTCTIVVSTNWDIPARTWHSHPFFCVGT